MTARDDLCEVNAALKELARLQLAGEIDATEAWQARRDMLQSVEAAWHDLSQDLTPEAMASVQPVNAPIRLSWRERWQRRQPIALKVSLPSFKRPQLPIWPSFNWQRLISSDRLASISPLAWWTLSLAVALLTFYYVSTL